eukprot:2875677-Alexandrium_andersonii.AAC.1
MSASTSRAASGWGAAARSLGRGPTPSSRRSLPLRSGRGGGSRGSRRCRRPSRRSRQAAASA